MPTLIVHGDSDMMIPFEVSGRKVAEAIPHCELKIYENASHGLFVSHKDRLNGDLCSFVEDSNRRVKSTGVDDRQTSGR